jgi:hypothetical protein
MAVLDTAKLAALRAEMERLRDSRVDRGEETPPFIGTWETVDVMLDMHDTVDALEAERDGLTESAADAISELRGANAEIDMLRAIVEGEYRWLSGRRTVNQHFLAAGYWLTLDA